LFKLFTADNMIHFDAAGSQIYFVLKEAPFRAS